MGTCSDLFLALLALDHSRRQPWGAYHGVSVATYMLQHSSLSTMSTLRSQWELTTVFVDRGIESVHAHTKTLVARNRGRAAALHTALETSVNFDRPPMRFAVTIADVSVDGSFPPADFATRVAAWALSTVQAWSERDRAPSR